ncbi:MAG: class I SAM-dependent methyltransferase [Solirubrobacteraceae bacterium]
MSLDCLACGGRLHETAALVGRDRVSGVPGCWSIHAGTSCGSGTTLPLVDEAQLDAFYPADYAPYELPSGALGQLMTLLQRGRNRSFPLNRLAGGDGGPRTLLDVGCGRGDLAASWVEAGWRVLGIEPSPEAAEVARARGVETQVGTLATAKLPLAALDGVVFRHSLEHVVRPRVDLRTVREALRPGGHLIVIVPNWGSWQRRAFGEYWFPLELPRHRTHFTAAGLHAALESAGFEQIDVRTATPFITTTWSLQLRIFDRILSRSGVPLLAGYASSAPVAVVSNLLDRLLGGGDFLHAHAVAGPMD